ncbi:hypothetical protein J7I85_22500 [Arthrobacter sp. ISL-65]|nr:hypothetical protein [Arthrobacter sp. ISL-65]
MPVNGGGILADEGELAWWSIVDGPGRSSAVGEINEFGDEFADGLLGSGLV